MTVAKLLEKKTKLFAQKQENEKKDYSAEINKLVEEYRAKLVNEVEATRKQNSDKLDMYIQFINELLDEDAAEEAMPAEDTEEVPVA